MSDLLTFPEWVDGPERQVPRSECHRVTIPTLFYDDHVFRALTAGVVVKSGKYVTTVWLDQICLEDLIGDADYYDSFEGEERAWNRSVCDSARSTLRSLKRQLPQAQVIHTELVARMNALLTKMPR